MQLIENCKTDSFLAKGTYPFLDVWVRQSCLQQFDSNEPTQHDSISDSEDNPRNEDIDEETKLKPFQTAIHEIDFEPELHCNNIVKAESLEESIIEIKEEFASTETLENLEVHENYNITLSIGN